MGRVYVAAKNKFSVRVRWKCDLHTSSHLFFIIEIPAFETLENVNKV